jgi:Dyp-type peroxidase family
MSVNLDLAPNSVDLGSDAYKALRKNLQSNIVKAHAREHQRLVFLEFTGTPAQTKTWIKANVLAKITTAEDQHQHSIKRAADRTFDGGLMANLVLSADGYRKLGFAIDGFASKAFRSGMKAEGSPKKDPAASSWEAGFRGVIHAMVAFAASSETAVENAASALGASAGGIVKVLVVERGRALKTANGLELEHFGYADGISNPKFDMNDLPSSQTALEWDEGAALRLALTTDPLAATVPDALGSYLVFRKLGQDVALFESRVGQLAATFGYTQELAGALVVGRFKDGTPTLDSATPSGLAKPNNNFDFSEDNSKSKCPAHAHIRKANPRGTTPLTSLEGERKRRIVRRGVPYGKPVFPIADATFRDTSTTAARGLLFMCFQQNIEKQFAFIQRTWADSPSFPEGLIPVVTKDTGDDPLIGQDPDEGQRWPKVYGNEDAGRKRFNFESAVTLKGGEYFFAPSMAFIESL